jgi:hypothetical protein
MAKCKLCNKKSLLLRTNKDGVCEACIDERFPYFERCCTVINKTVALLNEPSGRQTILNHCDTLLTNLKPLHEMELKGIAGWLDKPASEAIAEVEATRGELIEEMAHELTEEVQKEADRAAIAPAKVDALNRGIAELEALEKEFGKYDVIAQNIRVLKAVAYNVNLKKFMDAAKKAEAEENYITALGQYREALFLLKDEHVKDSAQAKTIAQLEQKIAFLKQQE